MIHLQKRCTKSYYTKIFGQQTCDHELLYKEGGAWRGEKGRKKQEKGTEAGRRHKNKYETFSSEGGTHSKLVNCERCYKSSRDSVIVLRGSSESKTQGFPIQLQTE